MLFSNRRLCRHKHLYRTLNIPHSVASAWVFVDNVDLVYNEVDGTLLMKPIKVRVSSNTKAQATAQASVAAKKEPVDQSPSSHFGM